jgi:hypothetical protein
VGQKVGSLNRRVGASGAIDLNGEIEPAAVEAYAQKFITPVAGLVFGITADNVMSIGRATEMPTNA